MTQTVHMVETLGSLGLLERLDEGIKKEGLSDYQLLVNLIKDKRYIRTQGIFDDFIPDVSLYNAVGAIYPLLNREQRDEVIRAHLKQFDKVNYACVNSNHTPNIREPLLLADIVLARPIYWPGLNDEKQIWNGKKSFEELKKEIMAENGLFDPTKVKSDFLVAYALMMKDITPFGEDYIKSANPQFLRRVMKGIVALTVGNVEDDQVDKMRTELCELLPKSVYNRVEPLRQEADWTYAGQFR